MLRYHRIFLRLPAFALLAAVLGQPAAASPYDTEVLVTPYEASTTFSWQDALIRFPVEPASPVIVVGPMHGDLVSGPGDWLQYSPESSFWELGTDSFVFRVDTPERDTYVTVTLQAGDFGGERRLWEPFEQQDVDNLSGNAKTLREAAIAGLRGLRASASPGPGNLEAVYTFRNVQNGGGSGAQGGTDGLKVRPPPMIPLMAGAGEPVVIFTLDRELGADPAADIALIPSGGEWTLVARLYHDQEVSETLPFHLPEPRDHELTLDWWNAWDQRKGGLRFWVDGELADTIRGIEAWSVGEAHRRAGVMLEPNTGISVSVDVDDLLLTWSENARAAFEPVLRDGFDADLGAWQNPPFSIDVTAEAALIGAGGLEIEALYGFDGALWEPSPAGETRFGVRMRLSAENLGMTAGPELELLAISTLDTAGTGGDQARLVLRRDPEGPNEVIAQARSGTGADWLAAPAVTLSTGSNTIELRWQAADPGDDNGWMRLWVDGVPGPRVDGLANAGAAIESQRLGAWNVEPGAQGALFVDAFESWSFVPPQ